MFSLGLAEWLPEGMLLLNIIGEIAERLRCGA
jgi:hypothetical protein